MKCTRCGAKLTVEYVAGVDYGLCEQDSWALAQEVLNPGNSDKTIGQIRAEYGIKPPPPEPVPS